MSKIKIYEAGDQLNRIANALEEILRLVKADQEKMAKRFPDSFSCVSSFSKTFFILLKSLFRNSVFILTFVILDLSIFI